MRFRLFDLRAEIKWPWKHVCRHKPIGVRHETLREDKSAGSSPFSMFQPVIPAGPYTTVLSRCKCGDIKTENVRGHWTEDEVVRGTHPKTDGDAILKALEVPK